MALVRDPHLQPLFLALCAGTVARLRVPGVIHFTYDFEGDEILASPEDIDKVAQAVGAALDIPKPRLSPKVLPKLRGQETIMFSDIIRTQLIGKLTDAIGSSNSAATVKSHVQSLREATSVLFTKLKEIAAEQPTRRLLSPEAREHIEHLLAFEPGANVDEYPLMLSKTGEVTPIGGRERDAMLAGLRLLQLEVENPDSDGWFGEDLRLIFTGGARHSGLDSGEMDALYEKINA
jgi:hypothetical protein